MSLGGNKMPKDTFFNLEEGKRIKIIKAAKAEFLNKPLRNHQI